MPHPPQHVHVQDRMAAPPPPGLGSPWTLCPHFSTAEAFEVWRGEDMPQERRCLVLWTQAQHLRAQSHPGRVCAEVGAGSQGLGLCVWV